jgi:hypothetical protein
MKTKLYTVAFYVTAQIEMCDDGDDAELPIELSEYSIIKMSEPELIDVETLTMYDLE